MSVSVDIEAGPDIQSIIKQKDIEISRLRNENIYLKSQCSNIKKDDLVIHLNNQHQVICRFDKREQAEDILEKIFSAERKEVIHIQDSRSQYLIKADCIEYVFIADIIARDRKL